MFAIKIWKIIIWLFANYIHITTVKRQPRIYSNQYKPKCVLSKMKPFYTDNFMAIKCHCLSFKFKLYNKRH